MVSTKGSEIIWNERNIPLTLPSPPETGERIKVRGVVMNIEMNEERKRGMDYWWIIVVIVAWVVLQAYILPKFGIST